MGVEVAVEGLSKSFGRQSIWRDVTLTLPPGEVSALLGPSGTGKSVFLKCLIGLLKPERGSVIINGVNLCTCSEREMYEIRKLFGVLFQDGALFGSMNLFDNVAFPLREHTRKSEAEIKRIVFEKLELTGLQGAETKLPGEISGGMRKRAGLARALVLDPEIILCDEPDSGLDPVRTAYLSQLLIDLNAQIDATILIVTHNINLARTVPDNIGMLFRKELIMFGPREVLLTSDEPVVEQFLNGRRFGPIGMSEEKDQATMAAEAAHQEAGHSDGSNEDVRGVVPQIEPTPGMPARDAVRRRRNRVLKILDTLPESAQHGVLASLSAEDLGRYDDWARRAAQGRMNTRHAGPVATIPGVSTLDPDATGRMHAPPPPLPHRGARPGDEHRQRPRPEARP
ncbi:ABC transporter ATP-binding protein [Actinokineospora xionganensis]|uniref:ATP-binding cassette domain-containing protein n=1 Tax=Actinokineospora xionganensis TaxID=2684470 RepID=A0ABR7KYP9_9PSEU|nr:ATP-binding cassette domain-containing protein [Actinokineospora xionganensis]MBC6445571.1 ATP-binding cassette domain-containing protein [Actinokineospora xionganensis]